MGGNAFPFLNLSRLSAKDYEKFEAETVQKLSYHFPTITFHIIPSFFSKTSFGDCDLLFVPTTQKDYIKDFETVLGSLATLRNGPTISFAVPFNDQIFQVDLILEHPETVDFARSYFSFNDLGNLIGRIFHRAGFKFGHKGLQFIVREDGNSSHVLKEITLTTSFQEALEFVGYDYLRWSLGFSTLEEVFKFAVAIPLANKTIFRLEETNHAARIRDRKRKTYQEFLLWVKDPKNGVPDEELVSKEELRRLMLEKVFLSFPTFKSDYLYLQQRAKEIQEAKEKFNGSLVSEWTGLTGKELGAFIHLFKETKSDFTDWLLKCDSTTIQEEVLKCHSSQNLKS